MKDILYTVEKNDLDIMLCSIHSLIKVEKANNLRLHIVCKDFEQEDYHKLYSFFKENGLVMNHIYPMDDFSCYLPGLDGKDIKWAKIFYPNIIKNIFNIHNLLYLDNATIIVDELNDLYLYNDEINMVPTTTFKETKEKFHLHDYFDTSVMYINLDKWEKRNIENKVKAILESNKDLDIQDIINIALNGYIRKLAYKYNINASPYFFDNDELKLLYRDTNINFNEIEKARENPIIVHINSLYNINPWQRNNVNPFNAAFKELMEEVNPNFKLTTYNGIKLFAYSKTALKKKILKDKQKTK